ncbi:hypothetical protein CAI16_01510 [Virgibacillus dokdonensis]|uniref:Iron-sulphur cluster biosynthesis n=2 Tax=Virgibacillus TaxID=84406 RepID=A0A1M5LMG9_9BACI|nr:MULTISPECIES: iron-sulfur cluster biosynthesis family protein [Virgibacillus]RFA37183.1 hypothetical protein CAI16_01510 [Virgibacillus dokdonensis]SHG66294.1 Iron-sulphur cluster biosynthesis [Virgibacillus chiguensis]
MELKITSKAWEELQGLPLEYYPYLFLWYDTEGCGCGVNGIPTICLTKQLPSNYKRVLNMQIPTYIQEQQEIFFAEQLILDYNQGLFRLNSPEEILNPFISRQQLISLIE